MTDQLPASARQSRQNNSIQASPLTEPTSSHEDLVDRVIIAANLHHGTDCEDDFRNALIAIGDHASRERARLLIAKRLSEVTSASGAGFLAVWLGAGVEGGDDPNLTGHHILDSLLHWAGLVETLPGDVDSEDTDKLQFDSEIVIGMEMLGQGLVAHVSRSQSLLHDMAKNADVVSELERVEDVSAGPMWVLELLRKRSGTLVVIHVEQRRGVRVSYQNLSNCFHLFTLLQAALSKVRMPGAKRVPSTLLAAANGETNENCHDSAWWHYGIGTCSKADLDGSIWGEANPDSIPKIDGEQVVLLWPLIMNSRQWATGFFDPFLHASPPTVTVTSELTEAEVKQWSTRLKLPAIAKRPWWKPW